MREGSTTNDAPEVASTIEKLRALGVGLMVDEFGKERVSLLNLARFPPDVIKIDRWLIDKLEHDGGEAIELLVSAMVGFAQAMDVLAFAEVVETAGQMEKSRRMGRDLAQGFYFWKALPGDAATRLLDNGREADALHRTLREAIGWGGA